jgi:hypothetical protein
MSRMTYDEDYEPFLVEPGWVESDIIRTALGPTFRILHYADGSMRFEHRCVHPHIGSRITAPLLTGYTLTRNDEQLPTLTPSIDCPDCPVHGFVVDGWFRGDW